MRIKAGAAVTLPDAPVGHLFVAKGAAELDGAGRLSQGDAARLTVAGARRVTADPKTGAEILVWEMKD